MKLTWFFVISTVQGSIRSFYSWLSQLIQAGKPGGRYPWASSEVPTHPLSTVHCTLAAQPPQPAELSQHHVGPGWGTHMSQHCILTWALISESIICSSEEFAFLFFCSQRESSRYRGARLRIFTFLHLSSCRESISIHMPSFRWSGLTWSLCKTVCTSYLSDGILPSIPLFPLSFSVTFFGLILQNLVLVTALFSCSALISYCLFL